MIENIRKYTGLILVVIVVIIISFLFLDSSSMRAFSGGGVIRVNGKTYDDRQFTRLGSSGYQLTSTLMQSGDFAFYGFLTTLVGSAQNESEAIENFFSRRILLREAAEEYGIHPSEAQVLDHLRTMPTFKAEDGTFDPERYRNFLHRGMGYMGLVESDLQDLVRDQLIFDKLNAVIGSGLAVSREVLEKQLALQNQLISGAVATLDLAAYQEGHEPSEEVLQDYWETVQDAFVTEPQRRFSYVLMKADLPEAEPEVEDAPSLVDAVAGDEAQAAKQLERDQAKQARDAELAEKRRIAQREMDDQVDAFLNALEDEPKASFTAIAKKMELTVVETELFPKNNPPAELQMKRTGTNAEGEAVDPLFLMTVTSDPHSRISEPIRVGDGAWLIAHLNEEVPSRTKTFEEAHDEVLVQYLEQQAADAMREAAETIHQQITESVKTGKSFAEAAKAAGITEVHEFLDIPATHQAEAGKEPTKLFAVAQTVDPGELAELVVEDDHAFIVYVAKRELIRQDDIATQIDQNLAQERSGNAYRVFVDWLNQRIEHAKIEPLYRR